MSNVSEQMPAEARPLTLGVQLRAAREQAGLGLQAVTDRLHWTPKLIEALEADDYAQLPEPVYVRGFVRSYAQLLGLDAQKMLALLPSTGPTMASLAGTPTAASSRFPASVRWALLSFLVLAVLAILVYALPWSRFISSAQGSQPSVALGVQPVAASVASAPLVPASAPSDTVNVLPVARVGLYIVPKAPTWVEIRSADGKVYFAGELAAGDARDFNAAGARVKIGNATQVDVWLGSTSAENKLDLSPYIKGAVARFKVNPAQTALLPIGKS